jgi:hypothetical protein
VNPNGTTLDDDDTRAAAVKAACQHDMRIARRGQTARPAKNRRLLAMGLLVAVTAFSSESATGSGAAAADFSPATCFGGGRAEQNGRLVMGAHNPVPRGAYWRESIDLAAPDGSRRRVLVKPPPYTFVRNVVALNSGSFVFSGRTRAGRHPGRWFLDRVDVASRRIRPLIRPRSAGLFPVAASPDGSVIELWDGFPFPHRPPQTVFLHADGSTAGDPTRGTAIGQGPLDYLLATGHPPMWRWSPNGRCLAGVVQSTATDAAIRYAPVGGGTAVDVPLPSTILPGAPLLLGWTADADRVLVANESVSGPRQTRLYAIDAAASPPTLALTYPWFLGLELDSTSAQLSPDRRWLLRPRNVGWVRSPIAGGNFQPVHLGRNGFAAAWLPR